MIIGIVPQSTCSFISVQPADIIKMPNILTSSNSTNTSRPNATIDDLKDLVDSIDIIQDLGNYSSVTDNINFQPVIEDEQLQDLLTPDVDDGFFKSPDWNDPFFLPRRNINSTGLTANVGPWRVGSHQMDGKCYKIQGVGRIPIVNPSMLVSRAMGIVASVSGFVGLVLACFTCQVDDNARRTRNRYISAIYWLAATSTWMTLFLFNSDFCKGHIREWESDEGILAGLVVEYGDCQCRAGCTLAFTAGTLYMISAVTVLLYSG
mmetsp:Transcript_35795/g.72646  ORF Transcript_35795/g.72646 Transcript_35795/m.72646 type:complete len:263 (-) Transcript_35795:950-1738(-)